MRSRSPADREAVRLIAAAASPLLTPLGVRQKGHSRVWIADRRAWLIIVEFQPGGAGPGAALTVGAHWLWYEQSQWSYDYGYRAAAFAAYRDAAQFAPAAAALAARAAEEAAAIRAKFDSLAAIARHLAAPDDASWPLYHAAVAAGLAGDADIARNFFRRLADKPAPRAWEAKLLADGSALARHLPDHAAFRAAVGAVINRARVLQGLPADPACLA